MTKQSAAAAAPASLQSKGSSDGATTATGIIQSFQLKGHLGSVLCLDYDSSNSNNPLLLSGSEDKTARIWDLRTSTTTTTTKRALRASLCIQCPGEVNSVVFGPLEAMPDGERETVESSTSTPLFGQPCCVFLAVGNSVQGFDLRYANSPVLQWQSNDTTATAAAATCSNHTVPSTQVPLASTDEINQIVFSQQQRKRPMQQHQQQQQQASMAPPPPPPSFLLAAADDAGEIRVTNQYDWTMLKQQPKLIAPLQPPTILQHSTPGAMIMACAFRPNHHHPQHQHHHHHAKRSKKHKKKKKNQQHRQQQQGEEEDQQQQQSPVFTELLATGGTDCAIRLWDVSTNQQQQQQDGDDVNDQTVNNRQPKHHHQQQQQQQQTQEETQQQQQQLPLEQQTMETIQSGASQVCNPPMVYSLDWSPSGRLLAAGLGDGSVSLFSVFNHKSLIQVARLEDAHGGAVASVHFPTMSLSSSATATASALPDRLLLTAGNDGVVVAWDLGATLCETQDNHHSTHRNNHHKDKHHQHHRGDDKQDEDELSHWMSLLQLGGEENEKNKAADDDKADKDSADNDDDDDDDFDDFDCDPPKTLFGIQHGIKPNWMVTNYNSNPCTIFVADTSNDITAYTIPS